MYKTPINLLFLRAGRVGERGSPRNLVYLIQIEENVKILDNAKLAILAPLLGSHHPALWAPLLRQEGKEGDHRCAMVEQFDFFINVYI